MSKPIKVCYAASSGGHYEQLMMLKPLMEKHNSVILTEKTNYATCTEDMTVYYLRQVNRKEIMTFFNIWMIIFQTIKMFIVEKPDVVVSTGALATVPACLIGKVLRKRVIFIESFAKITTPTKTGKLVYKFADQFYVQWESMLKVYPDAIYLGGIY